MAIVFFSLWLDEKPVEQVFVRINYVYPSSQSIAICQDDIDVDLILLCWF